MMKYLLEENVKHGDANFPVSLYTIDYPSGPCQILPCHWHEEYEIIHISRGTAIFRIGEDSYEVGEGQTLFVNGGELHSAYSECPSGCRYYAVVFHLSYLGSSRLDSCQSRYINPMMLKQLLLPHSIQDDSLLQGCINPLIVNMIMKLSKKDSEFELFFKGSLFLLLSALADGKLLVENPRTPTGRVGGRSEKIKKVLDFISENYSKRIYIEEMAELVAMNRTNLCRFFKNYTGMTPIEYLNLFRVNEACRLLSSGSCSVTDAAIQTGFDNMSYFAKTFKRHKNMLPSSFLKTGE